MMRWEVVNEVLCLDPELRASDWPGSNGWERLNSTRHRWWLTAKLASFTGGGRDYLFRSTIRRLAGQVPA